MELERWNNCSVKGREPPGPEGAQVLKANKAIGALLMNQTVFTQIGNIYRVELLYPAQQKPFTPGKDVAEKIPRAIWRDAVKLIAAAW